MRTSQQTTQVVAANSPHVAQPSTAVCADGDVTKPATRKRAPWPTRHDGACWSLGWCVIDHAYYDLTAAHTPQPHTPHTHASKGTAG